MRQELQAAMMAVALLAMLIATASILGGEAAVARAAPDFSLEVDTQTAGNTGDSLGPTEFCSQVDVGQSLPVDIVVRDAPELFGVEVGILYDSQILRITKIQVDNGLFLGKQQGSSVLNFSEATPDEDGSFRAGASDMNITKPSGNGTVFRITIAAKAAGISGLEFALDDPSTFFYEGPVIPDPNQPSGQPGLTPLLTGGEIRVGQQAPCPGSGPPPIEPEEPPPEPAASPTPTPDTPGENDATPPPTDGTPAPEPPPGTQTVLLEDIGTGDSELVVEDPTAFQPGDIIQIGDERLRVISSDDVLRVERGVEGTEASEHDRGADVIAVDGTEDEPDPPETQTAGGEGTGSGGSGTDLTGMPWLAVWATLGGLAAVGGGALVRLRLLRRRR